ncbi:MAG TPA: hypothetical protein VFY83_06245 [Anaerolineales bacterium]|nr:hypothetical protein [Anaerolineales bacterium]
MSISRSNSAVASVGVCQRRAKGTVICGLAISAPIQPCRLTRLRSGRMIFAGLSPGPRVTSEAPLEQIQLSLGHESIAMTERYLGSKLDYQDAAGDRLRLKVRV